jgi:hypothetical protein
MSVARDRLTFFAVMAAVGVAVFGYVRLGDVYPTQGRAEEVDRGGDVLQEGSDHSEGEARLREEGQATPDPGE